LPISRAVRFFSWASRFFVRCGAALGDQHHAGPADHPVHRVQLRRAGDALRDPPLAAHLVQPPSGRAGLPLGLPVHRPLHPPPEDEDGGEHAERDTQRSTTHCIWKIRPIPKTTAVHSSSARP